MSIAMVVLYILQRCPAVATSTTQRHLERTRSIVSRNINIALLDDHQMFLDGLSEIIRVLDPAFDCTAFGQPADAIRALDEGQNFDLFITDLVMAEMNGIAFVMALKARSPSTPVLVVSGIDTAPPIDKILQAGANGFVPKSASSAVLKDAIETAIRGDSFMSDEAWQRASDAAAPASESQDNTSIDPADLLGSRQIEVITLMAEGCSNKDIGRILNISENTVKTHVRAIFRQLGVTRRTACISKARSFGLVS